MSTPLTLVLLGPAVAGNNANRKTPSHVDWRSYHGLSPNPKHVKDQVINDQIKHIHAKAKAARDEKVPAAESMEQSLPTRAKGSAIDRSVSPFVKQETRGLSRVSSSESGEYTGSEPSGIKLTALGNPKNEADETDRAESRARNHQDRAPKIGSDHQRVLINQQDIIKLQSEIIKSMTKEMDAMGTSFAQHTLKLIGVAGNLRGVINGLPMPSLDVTEQLVSETQNIMDLTASVDQTLHEHQKFFKRSIFERLESQDLGHLVPDDWFPANTEEFIGQQD